MRSMGAYSKRDHMSDSLKVYVKMIRVTDVPDDSSLTLAQVQVTCTSQSLDILHSQASYQLLS